MVDPVRLDIDGVQIVQVLPLPPKSTKPIETLRECTGSASVTRSQSEWDDYVTYFLDWCIERGHQGEYDTDEVLGLTQSFDQFAHTPPIFETPFFQALKRAGVSHEKIDMPRIHPRYAEKQANGCKRPRLRIYNFSGEMPDCLVPQIDAELLRRAA